MADVLPKSSLVKPTENIARTSLQLVAAGQVQPDDNAWCSELDVVVAPAVGQCQADGLVKGDGPVYLLDVVSEVG
jgi:hypothetical protein